MNVKNRTCIRRLSWRSLLASRRRNTVAIIAIALTALLFTSLFTIALSINSSYETYTFRQIGGYPHGTFKEVTTEQMQKISEHSKVKAVGERKVIGFLSDGGFAKTPAELSFMDENCSIWSYAAPTTGRMPENRDEISMDTRALALLGAEPAIGTEISLAYTVYNDNLTRYEKTDTFTLVGWWEYDEISPVHYINVSEEYVSALEAECIADGMEPFRTDLNVMMASTIDIRGQMEQVVQDLGCTWEEGHENTLRMGVNWGYTSAQLGENIDVGTLTAVAAFLILVIFTGYLIIYNIFQISVTGDIRFYGLLKTIGVTPRQLLCMIRQQALCLCMAGIPVGLLLGYGVGAVLTPIVIARTTLGTGSTTVSTSPLIFIGSALFALVTVLLSCSRPGKLAAKVSPLEAAKYTEVIQTKKKHRTTRGAKVYQMALANLSRNQSKTVLVVVSLSLSVVLLNLLVTFTGGFDMEKYLAKQTCADFIVSTTDYFRFLRTGNYLSQEEISQIAANTQASLSGCGYTINGEVPNGWITEDAWMRNMMHHVSKEEAETLLTQQDRRNGLVREQALIEGLDDSLAEKLTVIDGDITPMFQEHSNSIAIAVYTDDYGNVEHLNDYPPLGSVQTITYTENGNARDVDYTVCAYVTVPYSMSYRYAIVGYRFVLPAEKLKSDSSQEIVPLFYLFDSPDGASEKAAEHYLEELTGTQTSDLMYESKATVRAEFESFQTMFLLLGGLLCAIIGLVGILNFFNAIMTSILSRKREFAVLQSVGMTNRQLKTMLIDEGLFYAVSSSAAALVLSAVLNPLVGNLFENMFWFFTARFTIIPVLLAVPVFALLGWLIPSVIYGRSMRQSIVERLRDSE